ncbi:hypothetical protein [Nonomuraea antri]|uniref:hypothetical protein n=1 Tax=Nonomuraea antri TaxID=2730852 RepID=UPI0015689659|nr:hypothetical protein [Nonomuraea antri]
MTEKTLITEVAGIVAAPPAQVWATLTTDLLPGDALPADGRRLTVQDAPGHTSTVEVGGHTVSFQGGWWYRGEWSVEPHPQGALLVHRVFNVARWWRWGVPLANRMFIGYADTTRAAFLERLTGLGDRLGCTTHPA